MIVSLPARAHQSPEKDLLSPIKLLPRLLSSLQLWLGAAGSDGFS